MIRTLFYESGEKYYVLYLGDDKADNYWTLIYINLDTYKGDQKADKNSVVGKYWWFFGLQWCSLIVFTPFCFCLGIKYKHFSSSTLSYTLFLCSPLSRPFQSLHSLVSQVNSIMLTAMPALRRRRSILQRNTNLLHNGDLYVGNWLYLPLVTVRVSSRLLRDKYSYQWNVGGRGISVGLGRYYAG